MTDFHRERVAGLAALLGGVLQAAILLAQVSSLIVILTRTTDFHINWDWNIPRAYHWISVSPWLFFLIALLCLNWNFAPRLRWDRWQSTIGILFIILAIVAPEIGLSFVNNCEAPYLPCYLGIRWLPPLLTSISVVGAILLGGYLLLMCQALIKAAFPKFWTFAFLVLGVLAFYNCWIALQVGAPAYGFFKVDLTTMILGFIWATAWSFIGFVLCVKSFRRGKPEMSN